MNLISNPQKREELKLTGNIDSYAAWNNQIHKDLKMKYYEEDVDTRIENEKLTNILNQQYNNTYFPAKFQAGMPAESTNNQVNKLADEIKIELRQKPTLKDAQLQTEEYNTEKIASENTTKQQNTEAEVLKEVEKQVIKELNKKIELENLEDKDDEGNVEGKRDIPYSDLSSEAGTMPSEMDFSNPKLPQEQPPQKQPINPFLGLGKASEQDRDIIANKIKNILLELKNHEFLVKNIIPDNTYSIKIDPSNDNYLLIKKDYKDETNAGIIPFIINRNGIKGTKTETSIQYRNGQIREINDFIEKVNKNSPMAGSGLKSNKKSLNNLKNRFKILKGEVMAGNDNPKLISELKDIIKILHDKGHLNKSL